MMPAAATRPILLTRVATAAALLGVCLAAMFLLANAAWSFVLALVLLVAGGEWGALAGLNRYGQAAYGASLLALVGLLHMAVSAGDHRVEAGVYAVACVFWSLAVPAWLAGFRAPAGPIAMAVVGWLALIPAWLALVRLQSSPLLLLEFLVIVWLADSAAYFTGRAWGRTRLAPHISPGKTWEGVAGAGAAVAVYYVAVAALTRTPVWIGTVRGALLYAGVLTLSIVGDLFESWIKRRAGVKDSGRLLPGHGGVLDRIDGLVAGMPFAALVMMLPA